MKFSIRSAEAECDGTLMIDMTGEVYKNTNTETKKNVTITCYLNTQVYGVVQLDSVEGGHLEFQFQDQYKSDFTFFCPDDASNAIRACLSSISDRIGRIGEEPRRKQLQKIMRFRRFGITGR